MATAPRSASCRGSGQTIRPRFTASFGSRCARGRNGDWRWVSLNPLHDDSRRRIQRCDPSCALSNRQLVSPPPDTPHDPSRGARGPTAGRQRERIDDSDDEGAAVEFEVEVPSSVHVRACHPQWLDPKRLSSNDARGRPRTTSTMGTFHPKVHKCDGVSRQDIRLVEPHSEPLRPGTRRTRRWRCSSRARPPRRTRRAS